MEENEYRPLSHHGKVGKDVPKIYFCAHPEDRKLYFESIYRDLASAQECTLFYDETPTAPTDAEKRTFDLSQMHLFVIPATKRLLTEGFERLSEELSLAEAAGIPILPLRMEKAQNDDEEAEYLSLYGDILGHVQFLDATAADYATKLKKYISSVLTSPEEYESIRKAFSAYIFLSYRKKDRESAQRLMSLIHEKEEFRNIAIWYDEFLTPGENFDMNIEESLKKSDLFVLAVTPSLLEKGNYVMEIEYPAAKNENKRILPVELLFTDKQLLSLYYRDLPRCVGDADRLYDGIRASLANIRTDVQDPEENRYLIGLAYLSGIDVETDHKLAFSLISTTAENGLPAAIRKLAEMHLHGIGTARDPEAALPYQKTYTALCKQSYENEPSEKTAAAYIRALEGLCDVENAIIDLHFEYRDMVELSHRPQPETLPLLIQTAEEAYARLQSEEAFRTMVDIYDRVHSYYPARACFFVQTEYRRKVLALLDAKAALSPSEALYQELSDRALDLSHEIGHTVSVSDSIAYRKQALIYFEKATEGDQSLETLKKYLSLYQSFYDCFDCGGLTREEAILWKKKWLATAELLFEKGEFAPDILATNYVRSAFESLHERRTFMPLFDEETRTHFIERALALSEEACRTDGTENCLLSHAEILREAADFDIEKGNTAAFTARCEESLALCSKITDPSLSDRAAEEKKKIFFSLAEHSENAEKKADYYLSAFAAGETKLSVYYDFLKLCISEENADALTRFLSCGYDAYSALSAEKRSYANQIDTYEWQTFMQTAQKASDICDKHERLSAAIRYRKDAILRGIALENDFPQTATIYKSIRLPEKAEALRLQLERIREQNRRTIAYLCAQLGLLYEKKSDMRAAKKQYLSAMRYAEALQPTDDPTQIPKLLIWIYERFASIYEAENKLCAAEKYYLKATKKNFEIYLCDGDLRQLINRALSTSAFYQKKYSLTDRLLSIPKINRLINRWGKDFF